MKNSVLNFNRQEWVVILVVALGYCIDAFDIITFSAVRTPSLMAVGVAESDVLKIGLQLLNWQLLGLVLGGVIFGVLSDKFGRKEALFGSIFLFSIANLINVFVTSVESYAILRFIAGIGLAGELGVGIALITENIPKEKRTYATTIVSMFGMLGAIAGGLSGLLFEWKTCYLIGFFAGIFLLILRIKTKESVQYEVIAQDKSIKRGNLYQLIKTPRLFLTLLLCSLAGATLFTSIGIFIQSSPEFGKEFGLKSLPIGAVAVMWYYAGAAPSEIIAGLLSKRLKSRKKPMYLFYGIQFLSILLFIFPTKSIELFYFKCCFLGFSLGFWTLLITTSAEQFGINLRGTASSIIPNLARAWSIPFTFLFVYLKTDFGLRWSAFFVGVIVVLIAFLSASRLKETFEIDSNFIEK